MTMRNDLELKGRRCILAGATKSPVMLNTENVHEICFVGLDPRGWWETASGPVDALREVLFHGDGEEASEQTLEEVENVVDRGAGLANRVENVTMKDHLPLDASFWGKERAGVNWQLQAQCGSRGETNGRPPNGRSLEVEHDA